MKQFLILLFVSMSSFAFVQSNITWSAANDISSNMYGNMHPRMSLDGNENPMVVWGNSSNESVYFSKWNGMMFTTPVKLNPSWLTVATASWMGPDIASHGDTVYVVVKRTPESIDTNRIFIFQSFNGGVSFNAPVELAIISDSISRFPTVATDALGNPIVAYMKFNSSFMDSRWVVSKSTDYGNNFSTDVKASGWGASAEVCDCCPGALVSEGNTCAMLYRNNNSNIRDNWAGISTNNANSFTSGFALENQNWMLMSCPSSGPDGVIIDDTLYSVFMNGASGDYLSFLSKASISNGSASSVDMLTDAIPGLSQQNYPHIAKYQNAVAIVWKQVVNGETQLPILFTNDITNGFPVVYDTVDLNNITNADIALGNESVFVVWQDDNSGTVKYRNGTYQESEAGVNEISANNFVVYPNPVSSELTIKSALDLQQAEIKILNILGETILSECLSNSSSLNVSGLRSGIYLLHIYTDNHCFTQRFTKF